MKKKHLMPLILLFVIAAVLGAVFFYVANIYNNKGLSLINQWDKAYEYNGAILLSEDRSEALSLWTLGQVKFNTIPLTEVDLTPFGFEGEKISYYCIEAKDEYNRPEYYLYTPDPEQEGFWPAIKPERLIYTNEEGENYCIQPTEKLCYPMFADSIDGVDPYGKDVIAFSQKASYAIGMTGENVTIYHTDPTDESLRIVDVKKVSFKKYGKTEFGGFADNTIAYFKTDKGYVALNCTTGEIALSQLDQKGKYSDPICRVYAQRLDVKKEDEGRVFWSHLLLGTERKTPVLEGFDSLEIFSVSPGGKYVALRAKSEGEEIMICSEKRVFSLTSVLEEGMKVQKVDFIYENLIYVTLTDFEGNTLSRCYKVCF